MPQKTPIFFDDLNPTEQQLISNFRKLTTVQRQGMLGWAKSGGDLDRLSEFGLHIPEAKLTEIRTCALDTLQNPAPRND